jgi:uroporphyrinogen decarboxylase
VRRRLHADVVQVENLMETWGLANRDWMVFKTGRGNDVLMPGEFNPVKDERGFLVLRDARGQAVAEMAPGGLYFDRATPTGRSDKIVLMDPEEWKEALPLYRDEELEVLQKRARLLRDYTDYSVHGGFNKFKMHSSGLLAGHTFTDWMCLLLTEKDYVYSILQATAERNIENLKLYFEAVGDCIDTVLVSTTDYGTQTGELISPQIFKELYLPNMKRVNDFVHRHGNIKTMYHTCGSVRKLIEHFIQAGVDILNPLQVNTANMDPRELKQEFGGRIVFWGGGVDTQTTYQFGTVEEVRRQVQERMDVFAPGGGYVFSTSHNTQHGVPAANIVAMADAVWEQGRYRKRPEAGGGKS